MCKMHLGRCLEPPGLTYRRCHAGTPPAAATLVCAAQSRGLTRNETLTVRLSEAWFNRWRRVGHPPWGLSVDPYGHAQLGRSSIPMR